jgi:protein phosphatase
VVIICRDEDAARKSFGVTDEGIGICYTRTGRRFFDDADLEKEFLERVCAGVTTAGLWDELKTEWLCLDCELMPWSAKAQELLKQQYAAVGASAQASLSDEVAALKQTLARGRHGCEAAGICREKSSWTCATRCEMPRSRIPPHHLRTGIHR